MPISSTFILEIVIINKLSKRVKIYTQEIIILLQQKLLLIAKQFQWLRLLIPMIINLSIFNLMLFTVPILN